jgi:hypothetical protein
MGFPTAPWRSSFQAVGKGLAQMVFEQRLGSSAPAR